MKILLIKRENVCYSSLSCFLEELKRGFESNGASADILDVSLDPLMQPDREKLSNIMQVGYDAVLTFNAVGQQNYMLDDRNFWDETGIPFFNYIVDHPLQHNKALSEHGENYHVICVDRSHAEYISKYYPNIKNKAYFVPVGGMENSESKKQDRSVSDFADRSINVLFTGTYLPLNSLEEKINEYPQTVRKLIVRHIEYMLAHRMMTIEEGLINVLRDYGIDTETVNIGDYLFATRPTEGYVRAYIREEIVRYLIASGLKIEIYGNGWEMFEDDMKNTVCHKGVPYTKTVDLYADSKLILDQSSQFLYGMHDRIPTAMLAGTAVLTDRNEYLESFFTEGLMAGELVMYDVSKPQEIPGIVYNMLEDDNRLFEMTKRAAAKAHSTMTWDCRAREILDIIDNLKSGS